MAEYIGYIFILILSASGIALIVDILTNAEPTLNLKGHFKPKMHFFYEKCSRCKKRLKHYHWFWGKGDCMDCDVDYHGNTIWYCRECYTKINKGVIYEAPHN